MATSFYVGKIIFVNLFHNWFWSSYDNLNSIIIFVNLYHTWFRGSYEFYVVKIIFVNLYPSWFWSSYDDWNSTFSSNLMRNISPMIEGFIGYGICTLNVMKTFLITLMNMRCFLWFSFPVCFMMCWSFTLETNVEQNLSVCYTSLKTFYLNI